jgi:hypothetical protein
MVNRISPLTVLLPPPNCHTATPPHGDDGRLASGSKEPLQQHHLSLPADPSHSCTAPSWASVVQGDARPRSPLPATLSASPTAVSREDFIALYERCVENGLKTRFAVRYAAGRQEVSLSAFLSPPFSAFIEPVARNPRRRRPCRKAAATGSNAPLSAGLPAASASKNPPTTPAQPPVTIPAPPALPTETSPPASPPLAKCTHKAVNRHCEVELLQGEGEDGDLQLSFLSCTPPPPAPPSPSTSPTMTIPPSSPSITTPGSPAAPRPPTTSLLATPSPPPSWPAPPTLATPVLRFRPPPTPPPMGKLPTYWRKVLCRKCKRDSHDISYRHCIERHFKENGYLSYYYNM